MYELSRPGELSTSAKVAAVLKSLRSSGCDRFSDELVDALWRAESTHDPRPVHDVVEAWYRTAVARRQSGYRAAIAWAMSETRAEGRTVEAMLSELEG